MEKFLNLCFKVGKYLSTFILLMLILAFIALFIRGVYFYNKVQDTKMTYDYNVEKFVKDLYNQKSDNSIQSSNIIALSDDIKKDLDQFAKDNYLNTFEIKNIKNAIIKIHPEERVDFYEGYKKFHKEFIKQTEPKNEAEKDFYWQEIGNTHWYILQYYIELYKNERETVDTTQKELETAQANNVSLLIYCFMGLVMALYLPLMIRIEENTRKTKS